MNTESFVFPFAAPLIAASADRVYDKRKVVVPMIPTISETRAIKAFRCPVEAWKPARRYRLRDMPVSYIGVSAFCSFGFPPLLLECICASHPLCSTSFAAPHVFRDFAGNAAIRATFFTHAACSGFSLKTFGHKSWRVTAPPVAFSIAAAYSGGTPLFDRLSHHQTWPCLMPPPIFSARAVCPPAI